MKKLNKANKTALGCFALVAVPVAIAVGIFAGGLNGSEEKAPSPAIKLDTTYLPVLSAEFQFERVSLGGNLVQAIAEATRTVGKRLEKSTAEGQSLTAVNFIASRLDDRGNRSDFLHFTIPGRALLDAARDNQSGQAYLGLTNEAGANVIEAERAVREYCVDPSIAFCRQVLGERP